MCHLEDVFYGTCGCWRPTPRVSRYCAVGKSCPYYKAYGCKESVTIRAVRVSTACSNCKRAYSYRAASPAASSSRRSSSVSTTFSKLHTRRPSSAATSIKADETASLAALGSQSRSLEEETTHKVESELDEMELATLGDRLSTSSTNGKLPSSNDNLSEDDRAAADESPDHFAVTFNQNIFAQSHHQTRRPSSCTDPVEHLSLAEAQTVPRDFVQSREARERLKALDFAEQVLATIKNNCGASLVEARRRSSVRHGTMPGMRERSLF